MLARLFLLLPCWVASVAGSNNLRAPFDEFPLLADVSEMANISHSVYQYKKYPHVDQVCDDWNNQTNIHQGVVCHWYRHDKTLGTQVMIVSSNEHDYLAVVFAGTDDLLTTLLDVDVRKVDFGTHEFDERENATKIPVSLDDCPKCKVHEGFNNAVFGNHVFDDIYVRVEALRSKFTRLFTTGHSLGAADSMLTAVGLALEFEKKGILQPVTSLNFGGPQVGNEEFRHYVNAHFLSHSNATRRSRYLSIWRFVLGWDLVPRLPEFFEHIGHTIQMHHPECKEIITDCYYYNNKEQLQWVWPAHDNNTVKEALTYYHHYGNETLFYSGVPSGWSEKPYLWVPGALLSHAIARYAQFFSEWQTMSAQTWIEDFVPSGNSTSNDALIDDDTYAEPPDDDAVYLALQEQGEGIWERVERRLFGGITGVSNEERP